MSSINSVRKLQILYFSQKNKKIKNLKNGKKSGPISAFIHTTGKTCLFSWLKAGPESFKKYFQNHIY